ncbi:MAG: Rpn family recombination-promoting nuclease/putative transposase [Chitinivibrionales bacterium]|nr:Rpn family recombination-promoting nuclease/putative transposase [Chitinivibrionales bacterium]MBD3356830.1 Rpn family recombination-promoting nuclease/putative transposase [Chitinivibrionales bacterium]
MATIVRPYSDFFVRYLLGDEKNKDLLISFLSAVNVDGGFPAVIDAEILNPINLKAYTFDKETVLDVKVRDEMGKSYDIEVQVTERDFVARSLYYWARLYSSQIEPGTGYHALRPVISVNLLTFKLIEEVDFVHTCFMLMERRGGILPLTDHALFHFLELPKFTKEKEFQTSLEKWLAYFKYEGEREDIMKTLVGEDPVVGKAHGLYEDFTRDRELMEKYEARLKWQLDYNSGMHYAEQKGRAEGREEGREEGTLADKRNVLIRLTNHKWGITEEQRGLILSANDPAKLDAALDAVLFADSVGEILRHLA